MINFYILDINHLSSFWVFCLFCLFRAAPVANGGSQASGLIRATAAGLCHSHGNARSEPHLWPTPQLTAMPDPSRICDLHHSSQQCQILNPLSRPGIKPTSSWFLVGFISAAPQRELPYMFLKYFLQFHVISLLMVLYAVQTF